MPGRAIEKSKAWKTSDRLPEKGTGPMNLDAALELLSRSPEAPLDVAEIALRLARDEYPELDVDADLGELAAMAHEAGRYLRGDLAAKVTGLCRYLFHDMGFHGNAKDYYDPRNSYLNQVLERRTGIPITLSVLTLAVGQRAGLAVEGVGLPGHFIVKVVEGPHEILIDPFHGGRVLTDVDCENLVRQVTGVAFDASALTLQATPVGLVIRRLLTNLKGIYLSREDFTRALRVMERLYLLNTRDVVLRRDLGAALVKVGQFGKALDHLRFYLEQAPEADDVKVIDKILKNAERQVAEWN
jgi:regulator of sirC expression with transglutaminase-like and TPR domain